MKTTTSKKKRIRYPNPVKAPKLREMERKIQEDIIDVVEPLQPDDKPKVRWANVYQSPRKSNKKFTEHWNQLIEDIAERENFKRGHLYQLEVLCTLYVDLEKLDLFLDKKGMTYESSTANSYQLKPYPELIQKNRVLSEIRSYSKMLGLLLVKDTNFVDPEEGEDSWS